MSSTAGAITLQADHALLRGRPGPGGPARRAVSAIAALTWNPVAARELRARMRGWHTAALVSGYLCVVGAVGYLGYSGIEASASDVVQVGGAGSSLFTGLAAAVMVSLASVVPGLVAPSVSGERERQTLDLLLVTPLRPSQILLGKFIAALGVAMLLALACAPLFCVAYLLGGVGVREVLELAVFGVVAVTAVGALAMLASASSRRVSAATVMSYLLMLTLAGGPFISAYAWAAASQPEQPVVTGTGAEGILEALSPVMGASALLNANSSCGTGGLITPLVGNLAPPVFNTCGGPTQYVTSLGPLGTWQTWQASMAFSGLVALGSLGASVLVFKRKAAT